MTHTKNLCKFSSLIGGFFVVYTVLFAEVEIQVSLPAYDLYCIDKLRYKKGQQIGGKIGVFFVYSILIEAVF